VPDELLLSKLPAPALRLWLAVRKCQGCNETSWHPFSTYARMADVKPKLVYELLNFLVEWGWLERGDGKHVACRVGRVYDAGKRGGARHETTPKEGGTSGTPFFGGTDTPKEGVPTTPALGVSTNPERIQKESSHRATRRAKPRTKPTTGPVFEEFWDTYGHKTGSRKKAEAKWNRLSRSTRERIMAHLPAFIAAHPDKHYRPYPTTYLTQERWLDEELPLRGGADLDLSGTFTETQRAAVLRLHPSLTPEDFYAAGRDPRSGEPLFRLFPEKRTALLNGAAHA